MDYQREIDLSISALQSIRLIYETYATGGDSARRVRDVIDALSLHRSKMGMYGGLCPLVADAMRRRYLNEEPPVASAP